jgi:hypothetical protein
MRYASTYDSSTSINVLIIGHTHMLARPECVPPSFCFTLQVPGTQSILIYYDNTHYKIQVFGKTLPGSYGTIA